MLNYKFCTSNNLKKGATEMVALKKVKDENSWQYIDLEKKGKCLPAIT